jgi:hypothetical protein
MQTLCMKQILTIILLFILLLLQTKGTGQTLNPIGTYNLDLVYTIKDGDKYGYFGSIKVKRIKDSSFAMSFFVCKGAPSYNSGSFVDTVIYTVDNIIRYTPFEFDSSCVLTFKFTKKGIMVYQQADNINNACGFGHGVAANDLFYKKVSSKVPIIEDPLIE